MTWGMLLHNVWIIMLAVAGTAILAGFVYAIAVVYNHAYMRLVRRYEQKEDHV